MTETEFITTVIRMREVQKEYNRTHTSTAFQEMKRLEKVIDEELERIKAFTSPLSFQPSLFDSLCATV